MATASNAVNDCSANMRAAGYIEIEQAGVVGVVLSKSAPGDPVRILRVAERSPADSAGISAGDTITAVNGQPISSPDDARSLLFGLAGESVELAVVGSSGEQVYSLTRVPFTAAFGRPK
jgi:S1-C subfamily serine protease